MCLLPDINKLFITFICFEHYLNETKQQLLYILFKLSKFIINITYQQVLMITTFKPKIVILRP